MNAGPGPGTTPAGHRVSEQLAEIWARVLSRHVLDLAGSDIHPSTDFFDLGGDSLSAAQLSTLVADELGIPVPPTFAMDYPTLSEQLGWMSATSAGRRTRNTVSEQVDGAPAGTGTVLTALQEYYFRWMAETRPARTVSNISSAMTVLPPVDVEALRAAMRDLMVRHESLRLHFPDLPRPRSAQIGSADQWDVLETHVLDGPGPDEPLLRTRILEIATRPFAIDVGPLCRLAVVTTGTGRAVAVFSAHHLIMDGWSVDLVMDELNALYVSHLENSPSRLPALPVSYPDYAAWARGQWAGNRTYWQRTLLDAPRALASFPGRRPTEVFVGRSLPLDLEPGIGRRLAEVCREAGATVATGTLACWASLLAARAHVLDLVIMMPVPGRPRPEFNPLVGCLVQSLLVRLTVDPRENLVELVKTLRERVADASAHQFYDYEEFSRHVADPAWFRFEGQTVRRPSAGVEFGSVRPDTTPGPGLGDAFELPRELMFEWPLPPGQLDMSVPELNVASHQDGRISGRIIYNSQAFGEEFVSGLRQAFVHLMDRAASTPWQPLRPLVDR